MSQLARIPVVQEAPADVAPKVPPPRPPPPIKITPFTILYARFKVFDGVRAFSILWVVFHHIPTVLPAWLEPFRARGFLGVELFFAISGFLVTRSLSQCMDRDILREMHPLRNAVQDFLVRRVSRIFPPFFLTLLVILPVVCGLSGEFRERVIAVKDVLWGFPLFLSNYLIPVSKNVVPSALSITWSLSFEEQFYIALLFLFVIGKRKLLPYLLLAAGMGSLGFRMFTVLTIHPPLRFQEIQMPLHYRFDAILWASLSWLFFEPLGWLWAKERRAKIVNALIFISVLSSVTLTTWIPGSRWDAFTFALTAPSFALLVRAFCEPQHQKAWVVRALSTPLLVAIGIVSYEIYLIHVFIIGFLGSAGLKPYAFFYVPSALFFSFAVGWIFHRYYSKPIEQWMRIRFSPKVW